MSGVHVIAIVAAVATIAVIVELSRRRQLREKYALIWLLIGLVMAVFAVSPGLFNHLAHSMGVKNPPDLLTVVASLFLLVVCVQFSWEFGRMEDKARLLAEEVALLRNQVDALRRDAEGELGQAREGSPPSVGSRPPS
ncbi:MAG: DUF2304 domain-containing protein [Actinomycetota bacterium]|nr:DUF2304 domain-containing protein [Actinomycetota bacterium]